MIMYRKKRVFARCVLGMKIDNNLSSMQRCAIGLLGYVVIPKQINMASLMNHSTISWCRVSVSERVCACVCVRVRVCTHYSV